MPKNTFVRFEYGVEDQLTLDIGPYDYIQITYSWLRDDEGEDIAVIDLKGNWYLVPKMAKKYNCKEGPWSDVIIFAGLKRKKVLKLKEDKNKITDDPDLQQDPDLYDFLKPGETIQLGGR